MNDAIFTTSASLLNFAPAFHMAQSQMENAKKDSKNPHFKSDYANLNSVQDAVMPALSANGLCVIQAPGGNGTTGQITTRILHTSGEWIQCTATSPLTKQDPQAMGSCLTYLRRYSLAGFCGITQTDDDGEAAVRGLPPKKPQATKEVYDLPTTVANIASAPEEEAKMIANEAMARYKLADNKAGIEAIRAAGKARFPAKS